MSSYKNILFATDFSPSNEKIIQRAKRIVVENNAKLNLIHVLQFHPSLYTGVLFAASENNDPEKILIEQSKQHLEKWAASLGVDKSDVYVEQGSPKHVIKQFAQDNDIDLIIIGTHSHHGIDILLGSTANSILQSAPCDVLVLKSND